MKLMFNTTRKSESITVGKNIRDKFRAHSQKILEEIARNMKLNPCKCNGCKETFSESLQLDHAGRTFDDLVDDTCKQFNITDNYKLDFRTSEGRKILNYFESLHKDVTPQYLCEQCHNKKTNNERKYNGGRKL